MPEESPLNLGLECLKTQRLDEAIPYLEEATVLFPKNHQAFNYLGIAYAKKGLPDKAIGALQASVQLRNDIASTHYNLGLAYQAEEFMDRAREQFEQALALDSQYIKAEEAIRALTTQEQNAPQSTKSCARHAGEPAIGVCSFCHLPVCKACKTVVEGQVYCNNCASTQS